MFAIISLLEAPAYNRVEAIWKKLATECGITGSEFTPYPHFSWQIARTYMLQPLAATLKEIADTAPQFTIRSSGIGIFTGPSPVIYIPIMKDENLRNYHRLIWEQTHQYAADLNPHYTVDAWIPHITLAHRNMNPEKLTCAMEKLAFSPFNWEILIDNLALVCQFGEEVGKLMDRFNFKREE